MKEIYKYPLGTLLMRWGRVFCVIKHEKNFYSNTKPGYRLYAQGFSSSGILSENYLDECDVIFIPPTPNSK